MSRIRRGWMRHLSPAAITTDLRQTTGLRGQPARDVDDHVGAVLREQVDRTVGAYGREDSVGTCLPNLGQVQDRRQRTIGPTSPCGDEPGRGRIGGGEVDDDVADAGRRYPCVSEHWKGDDLAPGGLCPRVPQLLITAAC